MSEKRDITQASSDIAEWDQTVFEKLVSIELNADQTNTIVHPQKIYRDEDTVLAIHWHPEMIPLDFAESRIQAMYPNAEEFLIIPTQHNDIMVFGDYAGVEVDCLATAFHRKIQILLHFDRHRIEKAHILKSMIAHTYKYRQTQLHEFLETLINPAFEDRLQEASKNTGAEEKLVKFARLHARKLKTMLDAKAGSIPDLSIKNKLLTNYINSLREFYDAHVIDRTVIFITGVKEIVKSRFRLDYFYEVNEIIEEARALGGCVIVPHPEQFWPVLLADYDVDGYEVWNPQSREFTEFLIQVVVRKNKDRRVTDRHLLVAMGDDTHLGEKILDPEAQNPDKASREVGYQPVWNDLTIRKSLNMGNFNKKKVIEDYKKRLS
jgi:hypothetical protein